MWGCLIVKSTTWALVAVCIVFWWSVLFSTRPSCVWPRLGWRNVGCVLTRWKFTVIFLGIAHFNHGVGDTHTHTNSVKQCFVYHVGNEGARWAPHACCITWRVNLMKCMKGKKNSVPFATPMPICAYYRPFSPFLKQKIMCFVFWTPLIFQHQICCNQFIWIRIVSTLHKTCT